MATSMTLVGMRLLARQCNVYKVLKSRYHGLHPVACRSLLVQLEQPIQGQSRLFCSSGESSSDDEAAPRKKINLSKPGKKKQELAEKIKHTKDELKKKLESKKSQIDESLVKAAGSVADSLGGDVEKTTSELLQHLQSHANLSEAQKNGQSPEKKESLSNLMSGMKIESKKRRGKFQDTRRMPSEENNSISSKLGMNKQRKQPGRETRSKGSIMAPPMSLYEGPSLDIFDATPAEQSVAVQEEEDMFEIVLKEELESQMAIPPSNAFEESIQWTQEGKLWRFPIDNEQGMEDELEVGFHEHVFLDYLLEDFPQKGPIRHFMELVVVGLSKNPYITVKQKQEHVQWFKEYFEDKMEIVEEAMRISEK